MDRIERSDEKPQVIVHSGSSAWPWVVGVVVTLALILGFVILQREQAKDDPAQQAAKAVSQAADSIADSAEDAADSVKKP